MDDERILEIGEAIERVLIESDLSVTDFSRKIGYSRQYVYNLMKRETGGISHKIQLETLKNICDATGYPLARLLANLGYIPRTQKELPPNTVVIVKGNSQKSVYSLEEQDVALLEKLVNKLKTD